MIALLHFDLSICLHSYTLSHFYCFLSFFYAALLHGETVKREVEGEQYIHIMS